MNHITQEQSRELSRLASAGGFADVLVRDINALCNAAIEWHIAQQAAPTKGLPLESSQEGSDAIDAMLKEYNYPANPKNAARAGYRACRLLAQAAQAAPTDVSQILEQLANEPPISGNHMARTRVLLAADWYKNSQNLDTSQERVHETAKSEQVPLSDPQIFAALDSDIDDIANAKHDPESWEVIVNMVRAIEAAHGIKEPKV